MGYIHYFEHKKTVPPDTWDLIAADVRKLVAASPVPITGSVDGSQNMPAEVNDDRICFNGFGDDAHETFLIERDGTREFDSCKTARKPYDVMVVAVLLVVNQHAPGAYDIGSDGDPKDWIDGRIFAKTTLSRWFDLPPCFAP